MQPDPPTLHILCGKIASGKSTLAARLGAQPHTVVISEDTWLDALFADALLSVPDYVRCSSQLKAVMGPHVKALLGAGLSVVLDFPANTPGQRRWFRDILETTGVPHTLHVLDVSDAVCLARLRERNAGGSHPFSVTDAQFHEITRYVTVPAPEEGFNVVRHVDAGPDRPDAPQP